MQYLSGYSIGVHMTSECIVFPIVLPGYGTVEGMSGYQSFITWLKHRNESYDNLLKYLNEIEAHLGAPDDPETEWSAFEAIQKLKGDGGGKRTRKVHFQLLHALKIMLTALKHIGAGEDLIIAHTDAEELMEIIESAIVAGEEDSFEATQALSEDAVDDAIASNEWGEGDA